MPDAAPPLSPSSREPEHPTEEPEDRSPEGTEASPHIERDDAGTPGVSSTAIDPDLAQDVRSITQPDEPVGGPETAAPPAPESTSEEPAGDDGTAAESAPSGFVNEPPAIGDEPGKESDSDPEPSTKPIPRTSDDFAFGGGGGSSVRWGKLALSLLLVISLTAAAAGFLLFRESSPTGESVALALDLQPDRTYRYRITMGMDAVVEAEGQTQEVNLEMGMTVAWKVLKTNKRGVSTIEASLENMTATVDGQSVPIPTGFQFKVRAADDGRILDGGLLGSAGSSAGSLPGTDQFLPLLPTEPVAPGDKWTADFDQKIPFGEGSISYETESEFLRYDTVEGLRTAVIDTKVHVPLDMVLNMAEVLESVQGSTAGFPGGDLSIAYSGAIDMSQRSWLDPNLGELVRGTADADFDMTLKTDGGPSGFGAGEVKMSGTMTMSVARA